MAGRPLLALISLIFTAGACVLLFFVVLGGAVKAHSVNHLWFLRADTSHLGSAPAMSQWTLWNICQPSGSINSNCGPVKPAFPFDPPRNFGTSSNLDPFVGTHKYYYLSRFMFAFFLISLFFSVCSFFTGFLALCTRIGGGLSGLLCAIALVFETLTATLMTACFVMGRNKFRKLNRDASIGKYAFGFTWAAMACLLISTVLFCMVCTGRKDTYSGTTRKSRFGRKKSTKERGSFLDAESQRRVKDDSS